MEHVRGPRAGPRVTDSIPAMYLWSPPHTRERERDDGPTLVTAELDCPAVHLDKPFGQRESQSATLDRVLVCLAPPIVWVEHIRLLVLGVSRSVIGH